MTIGGDRGWACHSRLTKVSHGGRVARLRGQSASGGAAGMPVAQHRRTDPYEAITTCAAPCRNVFRHYSLRGTAGYRKYPQTTDCSHPVVSATRACNRWRNCCRIFLSLAAIRLPIVLCKVKYPVARFFPHMRVKPKKLKVSGLPSQSDAIRTFPSDRVRLCRKTTGCPSPERSSPSCR